MDNVDIDRLLLRKYGSAGGEAPTAEWEMGTDPPDQEPRYPERLSHTPVPPHPIISVRTCRKPGCGQTIAFGRKAPGIFVPLDPTPVSGAPFLWRAKPDGTMSQYHGSGPGYRSHRCTGKERP